MRRPILRSLRWRLALGGVALFGFVLGQTMLFPQAQSAQIQNNNVAMGLTNFVDGNRYHNLGTTLGSDGFGLRENAGAVEGKNDGGAWVALVPGGAGPAPSDATYITQTADPTLSAEQALDALVSGIMRVDTAAGVITSLTDSAGIAANISDESGGLLMVFSDSPVFTTQFDLEAAGVRFTAADGVLTMLGIGAGQDESLIIDFNATANTIDLSSGSGATRLNFSASGAGFRVNSSSAEANLFLDTSGDDWTLQADSTGDRLEFSAIGGAGLTLAIEHSTGFLAVGHFTPLTELHVQGASTPSLYINSTTATDGGSIILEDTDGAGCSEVTVLNGTPTWATVACPS